MALLSALSDLRGRLQGDLFPYLAETVGRLGGKNQLLVTIFEMAPIDAFLTACPGLRGRPLADRVPLARAFIAKAVHGIATTSLLIERLAFDKTLRQLCGWQRAGAVPSEATFSRAFAQFAAAELPLRVHEALIVATHKDRPQGSATRIGHKDRPQGSATRIGHKDRPQGTAGRPRVARCHRDRGAREAGESPSPQALSQEAAPAEGRARIRDGAPARARGAQECAPREPFCAQAVSTGQEKAINRAAAAPASTSPRKMRDLHAEPLYNFAIGSHRV